MKLRLPSKLVAAIMAAASSATFATLATGSAAYGSTTYDNLSTVDYFRTNENVYNTGSGTFYLQTEGSELNLTLTLSLSGLDAYQTAHDYKNAGYNGSFVTWTYNNAGKTTYGLADVSSDYNGVDYSGFTGLSSAGTPWTTAGGITVDTLRSYADGGDLVTLTISNAPASGGVQVTALNSQGVAQTLYTAANLKDSSCASANVTAFTVNMNYVTSVTLNTASTLSSAGFTPPIDYTQPFVSARKDDTSVGRIMFLGDSITHGVEDMSWRWGLFKTMVDNGIENQIAGPITNYNSTPRNSDFDGTNWDSNVSLYGGALFENRHYAQASGRTHNMLTASKSQNSFGSSTGVNYSGITSAQVGRDYNADTYIMMMGTNDILSDGADTVDKMTTVTNRLLGQGSLENGTWTNANVEDALVGLTNTNEAYRGKWGTMGKIIDNLNMDEGDTMYVMSVPTWGQGRSNIRVYADLVPAYNEKLEAWTKAYSDSHTGTVKYVDINRGLVDKTLNGTFLAPDAFFRTASTDYIHPNEQGALIIAGNLAQGMGLAGRTAGLLRADSHTAGTVWESAAETSYTIGAEAQCFATDAFRTLNGYTIDFNATFGNGAEGEWLTRDNALSITVGDGTNTGTLKLSEGYISWGDKLLFCQDNSAAGNENIRIAYHNGVVADNVAGGYYVWLGDMLIGQGLNSTSGSLNGITMSATGAEGTIRNLTWSDTAYAPTTNLLTSTTHAYYAEQDVTGPVVVAAGETATIDAETIATSFSMGANSTLNVNKNVTVQTGATISTTDSMHINLAEGTSLTFAGTDLGQNDANKAKRFSHLLDAATGDGTVVLTGTTYVQLGTAGIDKDHVFKTNYLVKGGTLALQDWTHTAGAHAWIVGEQANHGSLSVENGNLWVSNGQILRVVENGTLNVSGELQLGMYSSAEGSFKGNLELRGGETTVGAIRFNSDLDTSAVKMSGGTLRITGENAFADTFTAPVVTITGGTLKAEGNSWVFNRTATIGSEEGAVSIVTDATHSVTLGASGTTTTLAGDIYVGAPGMATMSEDAGGSEAQSGNLVLNGAYNGGAHSVNVLSGSSLAFGANLAVAEGSGITINGETGAYVNLTQSAAMPTRVTLGDAENWKGTVKVTNATINASSDLSALGNANSIVELTGVSGFDKHWASSAGAAWGNQTANIRLTDDGETHAWVYSGGGASSLSYDMINTGKWSGEGTFEVALANSNGFKYTGDISEWEGTFLMTSGNARLTFSGDADTVNATIAKNGGTLAVVADTDVTFNKTVAADSLSVTGHNVTLGNLAHTIGTITIGDGGTVTTTKTDSSNGFTNGTVNINAGGTLKLAAYDALGWGNNGTTAINMTGTSAKHATLAVSDKQTFSATLNLNGYTDVINGDGSSDNKGLELFADGDRTGTIVATGTGNTISTGVFLRNTGTITTNAGAELTISGDIRDGAEESAALVKAGAGTLILSGANTFTGNVNVNAGTLKVGSNTALGAIDLSRTITVNSGATLDVNGYKGTGDGYAVTLNGGILTNTGTDIGWSDRQLITVLTLEDDSTVNGTKRFGMVGPEYAATSLNLGNHTLNKEGANTFTMVNTVISGSGTLKVTQGILDIYDSSSLKGSLQSNVEMAGGRIQGTVNFGKDLTVNTTANSTLAANLTSSAGQTLTFEGSNNAVLTVSGNNGSLLGNVVVNSGTLQLGSSAALGAANAATTRLITIKEGGTIDINDQSNTAYSYTLAGGSLINNGSNGTNNGHVQTSALTLTQDSSIGGTGRFSILASNGNDSAINLNGKTLTKTGTNTVRMNSTMISPGTLVVKGGTLEFTRFQDSKNWSTVDADITISGDAAANTQGTVSGTFNLAGGHTLTSEVANGTISAAITTQGAATLATTGEGSSLSLTGGLNVGGTLTNTGALTLSGTVTVNTANLWNYEVKAPAEGNTYSDGDNGYLQGATMYLVKNDGGTLTSTATFTGQTVTKDEATGDLTFTATDNTTYYVNKGNLTYDSETMGTATNLYIAEGQSLTASVNPGAKKLVGSGTFLYTNTATAPGITVDNASNWTGTVVLQGLNKNGGYSLNNYGNAASWVELNGISGWDGNWAGSVTANLILENNGEAAAWTFKPAFSSGTYSMSVDGKVKGSGTIDMAETRTGFDQGIGFTNDISGWTGALTSSGGRTKTVKFSGNAAEVNATISRTGGTMKVIMERDVTFNRDVTIDNLTLNNHTVTVGSYNETPATMTVSGVISNVSDSVTESLTLDGSGTLVLNGANTFTGDVTVNGGTLKVGNSQALGTADSSRNIVVGSGAVLDVNGTGNGGHTVTLAGGTLKNSRAVVSWATPQFATNLVLTADSYVDSNGQNFGLIAANSGATSIQLGDHDLIKIGDGNYMLDKATITGTGNLVVRGGNLQFRSNNGACSLQSDIVLEGGGVIGEGQGVVLGADVSMKSNAAGSYVSAPVKTEGHNLTVGGTVNMTMSGVISGNGSVTKADANAITMTAANTYTGGTTIENGALILTNSNALSSSVVTFADRTAEQAPYRTLAFTTGASYNGATGTLTGGTPIDGTIAGLSGTRGTVEAATLTINTAADTEYTYGGALHISGITKQGAGTQILQGTDVALGDVAMQGGTLNFSSGTATANKIYSNGDSLFSVGSASGEGTATVTVTRIELGDMNNGAANHASSNLQVYANGTLVVTGSTNNTDADGYKSDSLVLGEWNADSSVTVSGNLLAQGADFLVGDTGNSHKTTLTIDGGTVAVKGVNAGALGKNGSLEMTLTNGGKLILGADGYYTREVTGSPTAVTTITEGTIGISADTVDINKGMTITDATFDTKKYAFNTAGTAISQAEDAAGGSLTVNGDITGANNSNLHKVGVGTLTLNGSNAAFTGNVDVQGGTLVVSNHLSGNTLTLSGDGTTATFNNGDAAANGTTFSGNIVANAVGGTLNVNGAAPLTANTINITAGTTLNFAQKVTLSSNNRPEMLYTNNDQAATYINFDGGYAYSGTADYGLLAGKNVHITMGGTSTVNKSIAITNGASLTLKDSASLSVARLYSSRDAGMNGTVNVGSSASLTVTGTSENKISNLNLANGSTTSFNATTLVENLSVSGTTANLALTNDAGALTVQKLLGGSDATLELYAEKQTGNLFTVNMGAAGQSYTDDNLFAGNLWVTSHSNQGQSARSAINMAVKAEDVLKNATVNLSNWKSNYNNTRIIMSLESDAKVAGINSANTGDYDGAGSYIRTGAMTTNTPNGVADMASAGETVRTLEITGSGEYTTNAYVMDKVNLAMTGSGTQTFTGDMSAFNGNLTVTDGTLAFTNAVTTTGVVTMGVEGVHNHAATIDFNADSTIGGLDGHCGTVNGTVLTINATEDHEFQHTYVDGHTEDHAVLNVSKLIKTGSATQTIGGEYTEGDGLVIANGVEVQEGTLHMKTRGTVTANFDVSAGATLKTSDNPAVCTTAASAMQYHGKVTLHCSQESGAATLNYTDGSTFIRDGLYVDGTATVISSYDKFQFIGGLFNYVDEEGNATSGNDITFTRPANEDNKNSDKHSVIVLTAAGDFDGTVHIENVCASAVDNHDTFGIQVLGEGAQNALAHAVVDLSSTNDTVLAFRSGSEASEDWSSNKMDGTVAGLVNRETDGGKVYADNLTIDTAAGSEYAYYGNLHVNGIIKNGDGKQTFGGPIYDFRGPIEVNNGTLAFNLSPVALNNLHIVGEHTATVHNNGQLVAGYATLKANGAQAAALDAEGDAPATHTGTVSNAVFAANSLKGEGAQGGTLDGGLLEIADNVTYSISEMTLTNSVVDAENAVLNMQNVNIDAASGVAANSGALTGSNRLTLSAGEGEGIANDVTVSSNQLKGLTLTGDSSNLTIDLSAHGYAAGATDKSIFYIELSDFSWDELAGVDAGEVYSGSKDINQVFQVLALGSTDSFYKVLSVTQGVGTGFADSGITLEVQVPEPSTSVLSLLALAGMAARRRRK